VGAAPLNERGSAFTVSTPLEGPSPEAALVRDMFRRALPAVPVVLLAAALIWGADGAWSAAYAIGVVLANLALSAALLAGAARVSLALLMAAALFGFLIRLGLIFLAVYAVKDASWMNFWALGVTLIVAHLGLLFWEMRYVSLSLAHPGLKPTPARGASPTLAASRR
jgi:hypothetical protein